MRRCNEVTKRSPCVALHLWLSWAHASVEEFDDVEDLLIGSVNRGSGAKLQQATGIGGCDDRGARGLRLNHFLRQQFKRRFSLCDVVDSG